MSTKNDITGDSIQTRPSTSAYRDGHERIFGKKDPPTERVMPSFMERMQRELELNAYKGAWENWKPDVRELLAEIDHHREKLIHALRAGNNDQVSEFSADIANFCMKFHELYGTHAQIQPSIELPLDQKGGADE